MQTFCFKNIVFYHVRAVLHNLIFVLHEDVLFHFSPEVFKTLKTLKGW
jgi:hypothetical protein